jgi:hypothetical protein
MLTFSRGFETSNFSEIFLKNIVSADLTWRIKICRLQFYITIFSENLKVLRHYATPLTLIRMTKDEKGLAFFKGLLL